MPEKYTQHCVGGIRVSCCPRCSTTSESVPLNATHGLPLVPVPAESGPLVNGSPGSGGTAPAVTVQWPPLRGLVASKLPCGLFAELDLMPFQNTSRPPGVAVASGSVARNRPPAMVTAAPGL